MVSPRLTTKTASYGRVSRTTPASDQSMSGGSFVECPISLTGIIPEGHWFSIFADVALNGTGNILCDNYMTQADGVTNIYPETGAGVVPYNNTRVYNVNLRPTYQNNTGGDIDLSTVRLFFRGDGGACKIYANSITVYWAEYRNNADVEGIKYSVDNIHTFGTTETVFGTAGTVNATGNPVPNPLSVDFTTIPVDCIVNDILFSANSGNLLWTWSGTKLGVQE